MQIKSLAVENFRLLTNKEKIRSCWTKNALTIDDKEN